MEFRILGPLEAVEEGRPLALGGPRQRALLALLLTRANEAISADRLIDDLWGSNPPRDAANALQYHVSQLRKALGRSDAIVTRDRGYLVRVGRDDLDLLRFERLVEEADGGTPEDAARILREALGLWRGPPLADLEHEPFAQTEIVRLEELRLTALELRLDADLALGRHREVVPELEGLVQEHPLRERLRAALMRALYASGRQADALAVYRQTRALLSEELGIEPSRELQELERAILRQDPGLSPGSGDVTGLSPTRPVIVIARAERRLADLLAIAEPLARGPERELILTHLVRRGDDLPGANALLARHRRALAERGVATRIATYTTGEPGNDAALLATDYEAALVLVDEAPELTDELDDDVVAVLERAPCDVGVLVGGAPAPAGPVVTPFGGVEHDWSAIELAAWLAGALGTTLRLLGTEADPETGRRDASRLLARASLVVQQVVGIDTEPLLVPAGEDGVIEGARDARLLVIGLSDRWRSEGLGRVRAAVAARAAAPTLFVRRGIRPSGIAPHHTLTRFTWTIASSGGGGG